MIFYKICFASILYLVILFCSCSQAKKEVPESKFLNPFNEDCNLKEKIITDGDTSIYDQLIEQKKLQSNETDMLAYAMIMANEYDYPKAYYDVYEILFSTAFYKNKFANYDSCLGYNLPCMDIETKQMALRYLRMAIEKGDGVASDVLLGINFESQTQDSLVRTLTTDEQLIKKAKLNMNSVYRR